MDISPMLNKLREDTTRRLQSRLKGIWKDVSIDFSAIYVAGGCMGREIPNDYDIFPVDERRFSTMGIFKDGFDEKEGVAKELSHTKNARTVQYNEQIFQFCNYHHDSLEKLVESFDFAHCKIGMKIELNKSCNEVHPIFNSDDVYISQDYIQYLLTGKTFYTGSEYPMSSLIRMFKYHKRGMYEGRSYIPDVIHILNAILARGIKNYDDFKDQLDAVDLGLTQSDLAGISRDTFEELYQNLVREKSEIDDSL